MRPTWNGNCYRNIFFVSLPGHRLWRDEGRYWARWRIALPSLVDSGMWIRLLVVGTLWWHTPGWGCSSAWASWARPRTARNLRSYRILRRRGGTRTRSGHRTKTLRSEKKRRRQGRFENKHNGSRKIKLNNPWKTVAKAADVKMKFKWTFPRKFILLNFKTH